MIRRLIAVGLIFLCTSIAWMVLGGATLIRTYNMDDSLKKRVGEVWGNTQYQRLPSVTHEVEEDREETVWDEGRQKTRVITERIAKAISLEGSDIRVGLELDHKQKGLLWYATYRVDYGGEFRFVNDAGTRKLFTVRFELPTRSAVYDDFRLEAKDAKWEVPPGLDEECSCFMGRLWLDAGQELNVATSYRSNGMNIWKQFISREGISRVRNLNLVMHTNFEAIDFPKGTISPTDRKRTDEGWELTWRYENLLTGADIGMELPNKLQPGPLAGRISFFAPVSLFFFIVMVLVIALLRNVNLHPMHFFFLSAAFFAFHLLMAYLADHFSIHLSFLVASVVSVALVVSYLWTAIGKQFALLYAGPVQLVYLVLFSYTFFFKGYTGLAITIGAVLSLFVMMQLTARVNWDEVFQRRPAKS